MASAYATQAMALGQQAYVNFKSRKELVMSVGVILALAFAGIVTSAYTADHIKKSKCNMSTDTSLTSAYHWSSWSAVLSTLLMLSMAGVLVKVGFFGKKSSA